MITTGYNFTVHCPASTAPPCSVRALHPAVRVMLYMASTAVILFTVCGNLLVIISVCLFKQLHKPTNILILSLAFSDIFVGLFVMSLHSVWMIESCWIFGAAVCVFQNFVSFQLTCVSVQNVALLALDRYLALNNPFFYIEKVTLNVSFVVASLSWLFSLLYNFGLLYSNGALTVTPPSAEEDFITLNEIWSIADIIIVFVIPCGIMIALYFRIFAIAKRHASEIRKVNRVMRPEAKNQNRKSERKAAKAIGILVFVFLLCLLPYYISSFLPGAINAETLMVLLDCTSSLFYLNSFFNPIIYALFYPWFQKSMKLIITFRVCSMGSSLSIVL